MSLINKIPFITENHSAEIFSFLKDIVDINSFTHNINGVKKVAEKIMEKSEKFGFRFEKFYPSNSSERFHLICNQNLKTNFYGIVGHFDTVHSPDSSFQTLTEKENVLIGPGVNDMKGGIVVALFSLFLLKKSGISPNVKIIFNSDEEIGSKTSKNFIINEMKGANAIFVFEAGRIPGNKIISSRKGVMEVVVKTKGKKSHAGENPYNGINAIVELADKILKLYSLNGLIKGLTVQPGIFDGGTARNVVPDYAEAVIDIRFEKVEDMEKVTKEVEKVFKKNYIKNAKIEYEINAHRMPLELSETSKKLIEKYINIASKLGFHIETTASGGVSDANILNGIAPVIDGLGPLGEFCHSEKEYIIKNSLIDRIKIFSCFLAEDKFLYRS